MQTLTAAEQAQTAVDRLFERLSCLPIDRNLLSVNVHVAEQVPPMEEALAQATKVQSQGEMSYYTTANSYYIVTKRGGILQTDCAQESVTGHLTAPVVADPPLLDDLLLSAIAPLLRRRGLFPLHAFAAARRGQAVLLVGKSGSGKTTAGLALVRSGWQFLSDDGPFLQRAQQAVKTFAWHTAVNVTWATAGFFPELQPACAGDRQQPKCSVLIDRIYGDVLGQSAPTALLLFPVVDDKDRSSATRMRAGSALAEILGHSIDSWDKAMMADHFALLSALVETVPAYRLHLGQDVHRLPELIAGLLPEQ